MHCLIISFLFLDALSTTIWTKHYCIYRRETKEFEMITFNQMIGKFVSYMLTVFLIIILIFPLIYALEYIRKNDNFLMYSTNV